MIETELWPPRIRALIQAICVRHDVGLLHAHYGLPDGWAALKIARELQLPAVVTLHGTDALMLPNNRGLRRLLAEVMAGVDHVVAVSEEIAQRAYSLGADRERVSVVIGGVSRQHFGVTRRAARSAVGVSTDLRLVVWVGRLVPVKRPGLVIRAFSLVAERDPHALLVVVGGGPLHASMEMAVRAMNLESRVMLTGQLPREHVASWQAAADIAVNTSLSEGTPMGLMESLVCGARVVAPPVGGIPDLVRLVDGGTVSTDDTPEALAEAMLAELNRPRDLNLAERARSLSVAEAARRMMQIYKKVAHV